MAGDRGSRQSRLWLRQAGPQLAMGPRPVIVDLPDPKQPPQMRLPKWNQDIQTLAPQAAEEAFTIRIRHWGLEWGPDDPDAHRGDGGVQPGRVDTVAVVKDESVAVRCREDLSELLEGPHGDGVCRDVEVEQASAPDLQRDEDVQDPEHRSDDHAEVTGHEGLGVIPHEGCPPLPVGAGSSSSPSTLTTHLPAHGARRHAQPELQEELRGNPLLAPGRVVPGRGGNEPL